MSHRRTSNTTIRTGSLPALKQLERWWRQLWIRAIVGLVRALPRREPPSWSAGPRRVLFLRHDRLGDMILTTAALRAIATSHSQLRLDVLASPANASVLKGNPHVAAVVRFDKRKPWTYAAVMWRLRRARYDAVVDCMVTAPSLTTLLLMFASGARHRIAVAGREGNIATDAVITLPVVTPDWAVHMTQRLGALSAAFGVDAERLDWRPQIELDTGERAWAARIWEDVLRERGEVEGGRGARRILVNVSAGIVQRRWPEARYVEVIRHLAALRPRSVVVVIGGPSPEERARAATIAAAATCRYVPTRGIREAFALVASADFVFTPDTSIAHAVSAFGKPAVAMYLPGNAERWGLYGVRGRNLESTGATLDSLQVTDVVGAIDDVLRTDGWEGKSK